MELFWGFSIFLGFCEKKFILGYHVVSSIKIFQKKEGKKSLKKFLKKREKTEATWGITKPKVNIMEFSRSSPYSWFFFREKILGKLFFFIYFF